MIDARVVASRLAALVLLLAGAGCHKDSNPMAPCTDCQPVAPVAISCPSSISVTAETYTATSVNVTYASPAVTGGTPPVSSSCSVASNSAFPGGTSTVNCTATDGLNRQAVCSFDVTVEIPAPPIPKLQVTKFLAFGDSITGGENGINGLHFIDFGYEYPTFLQSQLNARYSSQTSTVLNRGVSGESAYEGSLRLPRELDLTHPDVLLLMEGVNDFYGLETYSRNGPPMVANVRQYLQWDVQQAKQRNIKVFLSTLPPEIFGRSRAWLLNGDLNLLTPMNDAIRGVARDEGVFLVDAFADLNTNPSLYLAEDGLHLSREGRDALAKSFLSVIGQKLEVPQSGSALRRRR